MRLLQHTYEALVIRTEEHHARLRQIQSDLFRLSNDERELLERIRLNVHGRGRVYVEGLIAGMARAQGGKLGDKLTDFLGGLTGGPGDLTDVKGWLGWLRSSVDPQKLDALLGPLRARLDDTSRRACAGGRKFAADLVGEVGALLQDIGDILGRPPAANTDPPSAATPPAEDDGTSA